MESVEAVVMKLHPKVVEQLVEIFKAVADECDGGEAPDDIRSAYADAMQIPEFREFYGDLVDSNPFNELI